MANKEILARVKNKRDTSSNWTQNNPVLLNGEIILVDTAEGELRAKIGDGVKTYTQLPFSDEALRSLINNNKVTVDDALSSTSTNPVQNKVVNTAIINLNTLVGDTSVAEQITAALTSNKSDWNQNDDTQANYIENRPFYTGENISQDIISSQTVEGFEANYNESAAYSTNQVRFILNSGQTYTAVWDGTEYELEAYPLYGDIYIGNASLYYSDGPETDQPFAVIYEPGGETGYDYCYLASDDPSVTSHTFALSTISPEIVKIDEKYLPDVVARLGSGKKSVVTNYATDASGIFSFAQGYYTTASGYASHAEGGSTVAEGENSHAEGYRTKVSTQDIDVGPVYSGLQNGEYAHSEGMSTVAVGAVSHAEGAATKTTGKYSHSEGTKTLASGEASHAEGESSVASGYISHSEGSQTTASGSYSHAEGRGTKASSMSQHAQGKYNVEDTSGKYSHIVGNGTSDTARSNAHTLDWSGNAWFAGDIKIGGTGYSDSGAKAIATQEYVDNNKLTVDDSLSSTSTNAVQNKVVNTAISNLQTLVGDTSVSEQINSALVTNQPDWNQNDDAQTGYIKNRPFYSNGVTTTQVLQTTTLSASDFWENNGVSYCILDYAPFLVDGQKYTVICDGETYECTAITVGDGELVLGNPGLSLGALADNSLPFSFYLYYIGETETDNGMDFAAKGDITDHTISIQAHIEDIIPIEEKYLSNSIGKQGTGLYSEIFNLSGNDACGKYSHAEGFVTSARGEASHAEGSYAVASGEASHAEGSSKALGEGSHSEGKYTLAQGEASHAEGSYSSSFGNYSHASGNYTKSIGESSHAEGHYTMSAGEYSHSEGYGNAKVNLVTADANVTQYKLASSFENLVGGYISYNGTVAKIIAYDSDTRIATTDVTLSTTAINSEKFYIHQSGVACGIGAHLEGYDNNAIGDYSHAEGQGTKALGVGQHTQGKYNLEDASSTYAHIVGNGTSNTARSNAHTIDWSGNAWFAGDIKVGGTGYDDSNAQLIATVAMLQAMLPKVTTITLGTTWTGSASPYYQDVALSCCTETSIVDLQPTPTQLADWQDAGLAFTTQSGDGTVRVYVAGGKPTAEISVQVKVQEVVQV